MSFDDRDILLLHEILDMIGAVDAYTTALSEDEFYQNNVVKDAVLLRLIMIGELVS